MVEFKALEDFKAGTLRVFHGTSSVFDRFDFEHSIRDGAAGNGYLGVWFAVDPNLARKFGPIVLEVEVSIKSAYLMTVAELHRLHLSSRSNESERDFYKEHRARLIEEGFDSVLVSETDGSVRMLICLVEDAVSIKQVFKA